MKVVVRKNVFETNSSSVHSICISRDSVSTADLKGKRIEFYLDDFGWAFEEANKANYLYTAIMVNDKSEEYLNKLKSILDKYGVGYSFEPPKYWDEDKKYIDNGSIDHSYETGEFLEAVFENEDLLLRYLFNDKSAVFTGNDNSDGFWRYKGAYQGFDKALDDDNNTVDNPYHDEEKFDYFIKGN